MPPDPYRATGPPNGALPGHGKGATILPSLFSLLAFKNLSLMLILRPP
jgi:hypothetical protein